MKISKRVELADWVSTDLYLDIDWPLVQQKLGLDQVEWLLKQDRNNCQLILDKSNINFKLVAEFYNPKTLMTYYLMWTK